MRMDYFPKVGPAARGDDIPAVDYLKWYIPRLKQQRPHNLSFSGLQFPWVLEGIEDVWRDHRRPGYDDRSLIAKRYGVKENMVHLCSGATQGITLGILAASKGGKVAVEMPSYGPVSQTARLLGLDTIAVHRKPADGPWLIDRREWKEKLSDVDMVIITPQLNPVGWTYTVEDRQWLIDTCLELGVIIISDEVYADSDPQWKPFFLEGANCITLSSFTKVHGLGALRYGWLIASEDYISIIADIFHNLAGEMPSPTIRIVGHIEERLDEPIELIEKYRAANLPLLVAMLARLDIEWKPPAFGIFGAFKIPGIDTKEMIDTIGKEHGLLAVPGCMFGPGLTEWLRVAWSIDEDAFAEAILVLEKVINIARKQG
jgi:aspartate/methionine/tyrosine aminotransferase